MNHNFSGDFFCEIDSSFMMITDKGSGITKKNPEFGNTMPCQTCLKPVFFDKFRLPRIVNLDKD